MISLPAPRFTLVSASRPAFAEIGAWCWAVPPCPRSGLSAGSLGFNLQVKLRPLRLPSDCCWRARARAWPARGSSSTRLPCVCVSVRARAGGRAGGRGEAPHAFCCSAGAAAARSAARLRWDALSRLSLTVCDSLKLHVSRCLLHPIFEPSIPSAPRRQAAQQVKFTQETALTRRDKFGHTRLRRLLYVWDSFKAPPSLRICMLLDFTARINKTESWKVKEEASYGML